jgi:hypothetical protein
MKMRLLTTSILFFLFTSAGASTVTVDFESVATGNPPATFTTQGYTFNIAGSGGISIITPVAGNETGNVFTFCGGCVNPIEFSMESANGDLFSLHSFDFGFYDAPGADERPLTVVGRYADNSEISATYDANWGFLETINLGPGWENLAAVIFSVDATDFNTGFEISGYDNIVVTAVPIPAAVWLFGSALAGLGWLRRK